MHLQVAELFAGVGGFRLGLEAAGHEVVWANQWEPSIKAQHAYDCYVRHFGDDHASNEDIGKLDASDIPNHELLVGGFPCQDYSVANTLARAGGIQGKKGVLWWEIERITREHQPPYLLLENVDRLLRSPAKQRGRDFGVLLKCLAKLGYAVEWRVLNAADHGYPQKRRRAFIFAAHASTPWGAFLVDNAASPDHFAREGFFAREFPVVQQQVKLGVEQDPDARLKGGLKKVSDDFTFHFQNAGVMAEGAIWTQRLQARRAPIATLGSVLETGVDERYVIPDDKLADWKYAKGSKDEERTAKNGHTYRYKEGAIPFPDHLDQPSRTLLTGEGGTTAGRSKHIVLDPETKRYRVLTPVECERLNGFPEDWTAGMPENWRYFCMGNALVVGLVEQMGRVLAKTLDEPEATIAAPA